MRVTSTRAYTRPIPIPKMPSGLVELMEGLTKDVLKHNPIDIYEFCAHHMQKLLEVRDGQTLRQSLTLENKISKAQKKVQQRAEERRRKYDEENHHLTSKTDRDLESLHEKPEKTNNGQKSNPVTEATLKAPVHHDLIAFSEVEISQGDINSTVKQNISLHNCDERKEKDDDLITDHAKHDDKDNKLCVDSNNHINSTKSFLEENIVELNENIHEKKSNIEGNVNMEKVNKQDDREDILSENTLIVNKPKESSESNFTDFEPFVKSDSVLNKNLSKVFDEETHDVDTSKDEISSARDKVLSIKKSPCSEDNPPVTNTMERIIEKQKILEPDVDFIKDSKIDNFDNISKVQSSVEMAYRENEVKTRDLDSSASDNNVSNVDHGDKETIPLIDSILNSDEIIESKNIETHEESVYNNKNDNGSLSSSDDVVNQKVENANIEKEIHQNDNINSKEEENTTIEGISVLRKLDSETRNDIFEIDATKQDECKSITKSFENDYISDSHMSEFKIDKLNPEVIQHLKENDNNRHRTKRNIQDNISMDEVPSATTSDVISTQHCNTYTESKNCIVKNNTTMSLNESEHKSNTMDLETAATTIQKVFRSFLFRSRTNSTFDDTTNDDKALSDEDSETKADDKFSANNLNKERTRPLGLSRVDTVLQTVNEEKSLSLSTDDSSTLSSAATTIQAHVRGFLVRNRLNSKKSASTNSVLNSDIPSITSFEGDADEPKKTVLNIHIVPDGGHFISNDESNDESKLTSIDLPLDGSSPSSNLHPLGYDKTEPRKQLKREDAIQSISPPSNNSGKLSEDSVKDVPVNENDVAFEQLTKNDDMMKETITTESCDTSPSKSTITEIVLEIEKDKERHCSNILQHDSMRDIPEKILTKMGSDEMDVIIPFEEKNARNSDNPSRLLHSGEFHDTVLPTKISRGDTTVVRGE